ncbi:hypothetical protein C8R48DRAFT_706909 [Suillus tomentosus]|nr:hypothetical protein C8R48DRAFT_706909 [Suillus tomentosus]
MSPSLWARSEMVLPIHATLFALLLPSAYHAIIADVAGNWVRSTRIQALARTTRGEVLRVDAGKANVGCLYPPWMRRFMSTVGAVGKLFSLKELRYGL